VQQQTMPLSNQSTSDDEQTLATVPMIQPLMNDRQSPAASDSNRLGKKCMQKPDVSQHAIPQWLKLTVPPASVPTPYDLQTQPTKQDAHMSDLSQHTNLESDEFQAEQMSLIYEGRAVDLAHIWNSFSSVSAIENALLVAMPPHYED